MVTSHMGVMCQIPGASHPCGPPSSCPKRKRLPFPQSHSLCSVHLLPRSECPSRPPSPFLDPSIYLEQLSSWPVQTPPT